MAGAPTGLAAMQVSRRGLVTGAAVGGGLAIAWWLLPRNYPSPLQSAAGEHIFDAWLKIGEDSVVTIAVPQIEMGQGITTLLPQIIAYELGADWRQIAIEPAPVSGAYPNIPLAERWMALWDPMTAGLSETSDAMLARSFARRTRFNATADGTSLAAYEAPCRAAGAAARALLAQEAAARWDVSWEECEVAQGLVRLADKSATFGELAAGAASRSPPDPPPVRPEPPREIQTPGSDSAPPAFSRLDLPSKVDGTYQFASDIRLPGMVFVAIRHGPNDGADLVDFKPERARDIPGLAGIIEGKRWLAAAATTWWSANQALEAMQPKFTAAYPVDSGEVAARL
ncbi:MAG: xanthine dehydrogenase family protein molybdopterin-binding subunit, partial [Pseudomonadota bacterium]